MGGAGLGDDQETSLDIWGLKALLDIQVEMLRVSWVCGA